MKPTTTWYKGLGQAGIIKDTDQEILPSNAFTDGVNIRFTEDAVNKITGEQSVFGTPSAAPYYALPIAKGANYWWAYASLSDIYTTDGTNHYCVSEASATGSAAAVATIGWNGGVLGGGIGILNNGVLEPWAFTGTTYNTPWIKLANWPAGMIARNIRTFKQTLVAFDIDEGSGRDGTLLRWSHPAAPGAVPSSWDYTNTAYQAGRTTLSQGGDFIVEAELLRDILMVYKENSTWTMQYVGGNSIYGFRKVFDQIGILSRRCAKEFFGKHLVMTGNDVVVHDGVSANSILTTKWRSWLYNSINQSYIYTSFVVVNNPKEEVWICFPEIGYTVPNKALIWNWRYNHFTVRELPTGTAHIATGVVDAGGDYTIGGDGSSYEAATGIFDEQSYNPYSRYLLMCDITHTLFYRGDTSEQFNGMDMTSYVERSNLPIGNPDPDITSIKEIMEIWPIIYGTAGGIIDIYIGVRDSLEDAVSWKGPFSYTIGTTLKLNVAIIGRIIDIKFSSDTNITWKMPKFGLKVRIAGER